MVEKTYTKQEVFEILADNYMKYDTLEEYWDIIGCIFGNSDEEEDGSK